MQEIYSKGANVVSITMTNGNAAAVSVVVTDGCTGATQTRSIAPPPAPRPASRSS